MVYQLIWHGVKPDGTKSEPYVMSSHDTYASAQAKKDYVEQLHASYSDEYRKAFGTGSMEIILTDGELIVHFFKPSTDKIGA